MHIALFRKAGPAGPIEEDPVHPKLPAEGFYPRQVIMDMAFALLLMIGLGILAYFHPVELGPVANPADTQFLPRPEWYYLSMFEWLKFWQGKTVVFAIVVVPGILGSAVLSAAVSGSKSGAQTLAQADSRSRGGFSCRRLAWASGGAEERHGRRSRSQFRGTNRAIQDEPEDAYSAAPFVPYR